MPADYRDDELQHWTLLKRKQQTFNVSSADVALDAAEKEKKRAETARRKAAATAAAQASSSSAATSVVAAPSSAAGALAALTGPLVLKGSFIKTFDGSYSRAAEDGNGKPHWANPAGMHLYWGPRDMWLLRSRFTPSQRDYTRDPHHSLISRGAF